VIIIDGLDECQDAHTQREVLTVLEKTIRRLPAPFAILISSRPEHHIRQMFDLDDLNPQEESSKNPAPSRYISISIVEEPEEPEEPVTDTSRESHFDYSN